MSVGVLGFSSFQKRFFFSWKFATGGMLSVISTEFWRTIDRQTRVFFETDFNTLLRKTMTIAGKKVRTDDGQTCSLAANYNFSVVCLFSEVV